MKPDERPPQQQPTQPGNPAVPNRKPSDRAPVVRPSGRTPAAKPSSRLLAAATPSAKPSSRVLGATAPTAGAAQPRTSARTTVAIRPYRAKKELIVAVSVLVVLAVTAGVMWRIRDQQRRDVEDERLRQVAIYERNMTTAAKAFETADNLGRLYCMGTAELEVQDIKSIFAQDASVYNVIFDRAIVNRRGGTEQQQQQLNTERLTGVTTMSKPAEERNGVQLNYGFADNGRTPVVVAAKSIPAKPGDLANKGGNIRVIVFAEKDKIFEERLAPAASGATRPER
jgi:hypothetical protein